jgi:IclR family transcriptional regulator, pca regulon regulatory protein
VTVSERDTMGGLAKGLAVIETFGADKPRQTISEVAAASGLDRATARRCLLTLAHCGYADWDGKFFTLTPRVLRLGTACLATMPLPQIVQPLLDSLADRIGESTSVSILDGNEIVYIARAAQKKVMAISLMPGSRLPAYCTSMGRVLLAGRSDDEIGELIASSSLQSRTPLTLVDPAAVIREIGRVREQGYAVIDQEVQLGLRSVAVPLRNARRHVVAALNAGVAVGSESVPELVERLLPSLKSAAEEMHSFLR